MPYSAVNEIPERVINYACMKSAHDNNVNKCTSLYLIYIRVIAEDTRGDWPSLG